jgi:16S rRNA (uracil1498-N3)-methyltransferase
MTRIFLPVTLAERLELELPDTAFRHLVQVLRLRDGDRFVAFDGKGGEYAAELADVGKRRATVRIGDHDPVDRESPLDLRLAQCVSKGERMDYTLQKAVELGVTRITPLISERSVVRLDAERWEKKLEHWRGVIVSACEQSGRTRVPPLDPAVALPQWLAAGITGTGVLLDPLGTAGIAELSRPEGPLTLLAGPEGGLSDPEIAAARRAGLTGLHLGPRVLRTETAAVSLLAALQASWGDWR